MATKETQASSAPEVDNSNAPNGPTIEGVKSDKPQYDKEELLAIFDAILFEGEYTEDVTIKGKLKVTFRSRSAAETTEITKEIDGKQFNLISALQEHRAFLNLVYSLVSYNGKNLKTVPLEERKKIVGNLPSVVVAALSNSLYNFDGKIDAACSEGEENF
jgi:hypothetical protein